MAIDIDERKVQHNEFLLWFLWTLATTAGMLLGLLSFLPFLFSLPLLLARLLIPLWAGFLVGLFQWLVLRRYVTNCVDWILNVGVGWGLGYAVGLLIIQALSQSWLGALFGYIVFGIIIGLVQWPVLRREVPHMIPWVLASVAGWALGAYIAQAVLNLIAPPQPISQVLASGVLSGITGLVAGAITGLALVWIVRQPEAEDFIQIQQ